VWLVRKPGAEGAGYDRSAQSILRTLDHSVSTILRSRDIPGDTQVWTNRSRALGNCAAFVAAPGARIRVRSTTARPPRTVSVPMAASYFAVTL